MAGAVQCGRYVEGESLRKAFKALRQRLAAAGCLHRLPSIASQAFSQILQVSLHTLACALHAGVIKTLISI